MFFKFFCGLNYLVYWVEFSLFHRKKINIFVDYLLFLVPKYLFDKWCGITVDDDKLMYINNYYL